MSSSVRTPQPSKNGCVLFVSSEDRSTRIEVRRSGRGLDGSGVLICARAEGNGPANCVNTKGPKSVVRDGAAYAEVSRHGGVPREHDLEEGESLSVFPLRLG